MNSPILKYKLLEENIILNNIKLYRIQALRDFNDVKTGDIGGYVQSEDNLSHKGNAWLYNESKAYGNSEVYGNAKLKGNVKISGNTILFDNDIATIDPIIKNISGFNVIITDNYIRINVLNEYTFEDWINLVNSSEKDLAEFEPNAINFINNYGKSLIDLINNHKNKLKDFL